LIVKMPAPRSFRVRALVWTAGVVVAAGLLAASARPVGATTTPSSTLIVEVVVTPTGVTVGKYASSATHQGYIPFGAAIPRGDYLNFRIINHGKATVAFAAFGRTTPALKPGSLGHFNVLAVRRGKFPYQATVVGGRILRGVFVVS
jgi:hypothetical protein